VKIVVHHMVIAQALLHHKKVASLMLMIQLLGKQLKHTSNSVTIKKKYNSCIGTAKVEIKYITCHAM